MVREQVAGPEGGPQTPFPIRIGGRIIKGFGRGSKELGIPTANIPIEGLDIGGHTDIESGVYYGWAGLLVTTETTEDASSAPNPTVPTDLDNQNSASSPHMATVPAPENAAVSSFAIHPMVMSIGWNPYYKNEKRTVEVHIIHKFQKDFYNSLLRLNILGFIRQEQDYSSLDALIQDIKIDIEVAERSLRRPAYQEYTKDPYLNTSRFEMAHS